MNARLVLAVLLLVTGGVVAMAGAAPQAALSPSQALERGADGETVQVKGAVGAVDADNRTFQLVDADGALWVQLGHALPVQVTEGATVVADGVLVAGSDGTARLEARELQIGCPSKY